MDSYFRPNNLFDCAENPSLDLSPIEHALPPRDRLLPGFLTLVTSLGLGSLVLWCPEFFTTQLLQAHRKLSLDFPSHVEVVLNEAILPPPPPSTRSEVPVRILGPEAASRSEMFGGGDQHALSREAQESVAAINALPEADPQPLPQARSSDGDPMGRGGSGGMTVAGVMGPSTSHDAGHTFDFAIVPMKRVHMTYTLKPGESAFNDLIQVMVTIEDDGRVSQARPVSGPAFLYPSAILAAKQWRFEALPLHGLKGPLEGCIRFRTTFITR